MRESRLCSAGNRKELDTDMIGRRLLGIDLGTDLVKVYQKGSGIVLQEKDIVATKGKHTIAIGNKAYAMLGRAPQEIILSKPIQNGVIGHMGYMQSLLNALFKQIFQRTVRKTDVLVAVPKDITAVEKRAFFEALEHANSKIGALYAIDKPLLNALGMNLNISDSKGLMTVDIGADTTEIAIVSLEGIVVSKLLPIGGYKLDTLIQSAVRRTHHLCIGEKTAEMIKVSLASAIAPLKQEEIRVYGRDIMTGLPTDAMVGSSLVYEAIREQFSAIMNAIRQILERTPPEIAADIIESGIFVSGGCAGIRDLGKKIQEETNLKVHIADQSQNAVIRGLGVLVDNYKMLRIGKRIR